MYRISVWPAKAEKSTTASARSAGPSSSECRSTLPALNTVGSVTQVMGWGGMTTGAGRKPPSVPNWIQFGPSVPASGVGKTVGSARAAATSAGFSATSVQATPVLSGAGFGLVARLHGMPLASTALYSDRLKKRSLAAFRMRRRYAFGSTVSVG